jgi:hypothetical protein
MKICVRCGEDLPEPPTKFQELPYTENMCVDCHQLYVWDKNDDQCLDLMKEILLLDEKNKK